MKKKLTTLGLGLFTGIYMIACASQDITMAPNDGTQKGMANARQSSEKITICHREGNGSSHSITVSPNAWPAHERHGDSLGECDSNPTPN